MRDRDLNNLIAEVESGIFSGVVELTYQAARQTGARKRYPAGLYNNGVAWDDDWIDELAQGIWANHLLVNEGLQILLAQSLSHSEFERRLYGVARNELRRRRRKTVIDRLFTRIERLLAESRLRAFENGELTWYCTHDSFESFIEEYQSPTRWSTSQIQDFINKARGVPRDRMNRDIERSAPVYSKSALAKLLDIAGRFQPFCAEDLRLALEQMLTFAVPSFLEYSVDLTQERTQDHEFNNNIGMAELVLEIAADLSSAEKWFLILKSQNLTTSQIAKYLTDGLGLKRLSSRPSIDKLASGTYEKIRRVCESTTIDEEEWLVSELLVLAIRELAGDSDDC